jgi:hypothetical protein
MLALAQSIAIGAGSVAVAAFLYKRSHGANASAAATPSPAIAQAAKPLVNTTAKSLRVRGGGGGGATEASIGNMPGANPKAYMMLPLRVVVFVFFFSLMYPMFLLVAVLRALYLRLFIGPPSKVLKYGTYPYPNLAGPGRPTHKAATHYPAQFLYDKPLDEAKLRQALFSLTADDGIADDEVELTFKDEKPNDWPTTGSYDVTSALLPSFKKGYSYINKLFGPPFGEAAGYKEKIKVRMCLGIPALFHAAVLGHVDPPPATLTRPSHAALRACQPSCACHAVRGRDGVLWRADLGVQQRSGQADRHALWGLRRGLGRLGQL